PRLQIPDGRAGRAGRNKSRKLRKRARFSGKLTKNGSYCLPYSQTEGIAVTHFLVTEENPSGKKLEEILAMVRKDILDRCALITDDPRPEARAVLTNNMRILNLLTDAILLAEDSTSILDKAFGPSQSAKGGLQRIGVPEK